MKKEEIEWEGDSSEVLEWEGDSSEVLEWEIDYKEKKKKKMPRPKYTKLNSGERIIKTILDASNWLVKKSETIGEGTVAKETPKVMVGLEITIGNIFITNQRLIFECEDRNKRFWDSRIPHVTVKRAEGQAGGMFEHSKLLIFTDNAKDEDFFVEYGDEWAEWLNKKFYNEKAQTRMATNMAQERERHLDYQGAIGIYEKYNMPKEAARVRRIMYDEKKVDQTVVHGDYVDDRDTIIKDSVLNRSNVGGSSKMQELEKLAEMKEKGLIDDDEFKQMKKEILGK